MNIVICSSIDFTMKIIEAYEFLLKKGHHVEIPHYSKKIINGDILMEDYLKIKEKHGDIELRKSSGQNLIKRHFDLINKSDAILVINIDKKGIKNYIGGNTFLEMGFAHVLGKKIFVYNDLPTMAYSDELKEMNTIVINRIFKKIK